VNMRDASGRGGVVIKKDFRRRNIIIIIVSIGTSFKLFYYYFFANTITSPLTRSLTHFNGVKLKLND
jgi:hypothetical protein